MANIDQGWNNNQNDFQVADFNTQNQNRNNTNQINNKKQTLIEFISDVQRMSSMEAKSDEDFDTDLFTIKESLHGFSHGIKLGIYLNIFLFIHLITVFIFSFEKISNSFDSKFLQLFIYYLPSIIIVASTLYVATLSRLAVGAYTNKAIITLFIGKLLGSLVVGIIVLVTTSYLFSLCNSELVNVANLQIEYWGYSLTDLYNALTVFLNQKKVIYFELSILLFISITLPFMIYGLRKYFFNIDNQEAYEKY